VQKLHLARLQSLSHVAGMKTSIAEHQSITLAIAKGDSERAKDLLATHVASAFARLKPSITAEHSMPTLTHPKETP
jgi:DNA-binding GntR family transcriptional regulator